MRRYWVFVGVVFGGFLFLWLLTPALGLERLTDPDAVQQGHLWSVALVGIGLMVADTVLPVPSVLIMVANGAVFGAVVGPLVSLAGKLCAAVVGFLVGRGSRRFVNRLIGDREQQRGERFIARWGLIAILVSRPLPVLAETVVLLAGASGMRLLPVALVAVAGSVPEAVAYGLAGATAASFGNKVLIWLALLVFTGLLWFVLRRVERRVTLDG